MRSNNDLKFWENPFYGRFIFDSKNIKKSVKHVILVQDFLRSLVTIARGPQAFKYVRMLNFS